VFGTWNLSVGLQRVAEAELAMARIRAIDGNILIFELIGFRLNPLSFKLDAPQNWDQYN
jgi:hypothetical protein